jgi:ankyrin repeat protein
VVEAVNDANIQLLLEMLNRFHIDFDSITGFNGNSLLIIATIKGHTEMVEFLVNKGIDINIKNDEGNTALHYAISANRHKIIDILISYGADELSENKLGITPWQTRF